MKSDRTPEKVFFSASSSAASWRSRASIPASRLLSSCFRLLAISVTPDGRTRSGIRPELLTTYRTLKSLMRILARSERVSSSECPKNKPKRHLLECSARWRTLAHDRNRRRYGDAQQNRVSAMWRRALLGRALLASLTKPPKVPHRDWRLGHPVTIRSS